jgi:hypothetical protein
MAVSLSPASEAASNAKRMAASETWEPSTPTTTPCRGASAQGSAGTAMTGQGACDATCAVMAERSPGVRTNVPSVQNG